MLPRTFSSSKSFVSRVFLLFFELCFRFHRHVDFIDNQPVLDMIQQKPMGILPTLDEELVMPKGSDTTFIQKMFN